MGREKSQSQVAGAFSEGLRRVDESPAEKSGPRSVTLRSIAAAAGCSVATVASVLNRVKGSTRVSEATRARVAEIASRMGYRPSRFARAMRSSKTWQIGALIENRPGFIHTHPILFEMLVGLNYGLEQAGYVTSLVRLTDLAQSEERHSLVFREHMLDGMVVLNYVPDALEAHVEELVPLCVWADGNVWRPERCLRRDELAAGRTAAGAMADLGYHRLIFLDRPSESHYSHASRALGVSQVAGERALELQRLEVQRGRAHEFRTLCALLPDIPRGTAVIADDLYMARQVHYAAARAGVAVGADFALACCDDGYDFAYDCPDIAHVSFDRYDMGRQAAEMVAQLIEHPDQPCPSRILRGTWVPGASAPTCRT